jgi:Zn-dependent protease/predicted transcriptional regulator
MASIQDTHPVAPRSNKDHSGFRLFRIAGIDIAADWSLLIVFAIVTVQLGMGVLPRWHPEWSSGLVWSVALIAAVLFFVSITLHELSHAIVARMHGITVRRITLFLFGGVAQIESEPQSPKAELLMAAVGPLASFVIGAGSIALGIALSGHTVEAFPADPEVAYRSLGPIPTLLLWLGPVNISLAIFNMLPGFPLDGGRVLRAILWAITGDPRRATRWASNAGVVIGVGIAAIGVLIMLSGSFGSGLWLVLIGWFLRGSARRAYGEMMVSTTLRDLSVEQVMMKSFHVVSPSMNIDELVHDHLMATDQRAFPVMEGDSLLGLVCLADVRAVPRDRWSATRVIEIMTPAARLTVLDRHATAEAALQMLAAQGLDQLLVVEDGRLHGLVRRSDILKWITLMSPEPESRRR